MYRSLLVLVLLLLLPMVVPMGAQGIEIIRYGPHRLQFVGLIYMGSDRLVVYVHGGAFVAGSAFGRHWPVIRDFFLEKGFNVATVEYRRCMNFPFDEVISDINRGVLTAVDEVESRRHQVQVVYVGFSAGATAGAVLLVGNNSFRIDDRIGDYIWLSGVYNRDQPNLRNFSNVCRNISGYMEFTKDVSTGLRVFMAEGTNDSFDQYPQTNRSHLEYMRGILESKGVEVWAYWMEGPHSVTIRVFQDPDYVQLVDEYLGLGVPEAPV